MNQGCKRKEIGSLIMFGLDFISDIRVQLPEINFILEINEQ